MGTTTIDLDTELRAWAKGMLGLEAATELVIRSGFARERSPWVEFDADGNRHWINFAALPELVGGMSGGEQRYLRIAASLAADEPIILGDELAGLDHQHTALVLAAVAHAAGFGEQTRTVEFDADGCQTSPGHDPWPAGPNNRTTAQPLIYSSPHLLTVSQ